MLKKQVMTGIHETVLRFQNYCSINLKKKPPKNIDYDHRNMGT